MYDQAIYAKAIQIKCAEPDRFKDAFLMIGTFYVILTFLAVIAACFKDAGHRDIVIQSTIIAEGSVDTMFGDSRAYNRAVRTYKILYKAFYWILLDFFELGYPTECNKVREAVSTEEDETIIVRSS